MLLDRFSCNYIMIEFILFNFFTMVIVYAFHEEIIGFNCFLYFRITCDDEEERGSRRVYRGCTHSAACKGCTSCVCFGCELCRFSDCTCQTCTDFTRNAKAWVHIIIFLNPDIFSTFLFVWTDLPVLIKCLRF